MRFATTRRGHRQCVRAKRSITLGRNIQSRILYAGIKTQANWVIRENGIGAVWDTTDVQLDVATKPVKRGRLNTVKSGLLAFCCLAAGRNIQSKIG